MRNGRSSTSRNALVLQSRITEMGSRIQEDKREMEASNEKVPKQVKLKMDFSNSSLTYVQENYRTRLQSCRHANWQFSKNLIVQFLYQVYHLSCTECGLVMQKNFRGIKSHQKWFFVTVSRCHNKAFAVLADLFEPFPYKNFAEQAAFYVFKMSQGVLLKSWLPRFQDIR